MGTNYSVQTTPQAINTTLAVSGATSAPIDGSSIEKMRVIIEETGTDIEVKLQVNPDGVDNSNWEDIVTYPQGAVGVQDVVELPGSFLRIFAFNFSGTTAEDIVVSYIVGG